MERRRMNASLSSENSSVTPMDEDVESGEREALLPSSQSNLNQTGDSKVVCLPSEPVNFHLGPYDAAGTSNSSLQNSSRQSSTSPTPPSAASSSPLLGLSASDDTTVVNSSRVTAAIKAAGTTSQLEGISSNGERPFSPNSREYPFIHASSHSRPATDSYMGNEKFLKMKEKKKNKDKSKDKNVRNTYVPLETKDYDFDKVLASFGEEPEKQQKKNQKSNKQQQQQPVTQGKKQKEDKSTPNSAGIKAPLEAKKSVKTDGKVDVREADKVNSNSMSDEEKVMDAKVENSPETLNLDKAEIEEKVDSKAEKTSEMVDQSKTNSCSTAQPDLEKSFVKINTEQQTSKIGSKKPEPEVKNKAKESLPIKDKQPLTTSQSSSNVPNYENDIPDVGNYRSVVLVQGDLKRAASKSTENLSSFTKVTNKKQKWKKKTPSFDAEQGGHQQSQQRQQHQHQHQHQQELQLQQQEPQVKLERQDKPPFHVHVPPPPLPVRRERSRHLERSNNTRGPPVSPMTTTPPIASVPVAVAVNGTSGRRQHQHYDGSRSADQTNQNNHPVETPVFVSSEKSLDLTTGFPPLEVQDTNTTTATPMETMSSAWPYRPPSAYSSSDRSAVINNKASEANTNNSIPSINNSYSSAVMSKAATAAAAAQQHHPRQQQHHQHQQPKQQHHRQPNGIPNGTSHNRIHNGVNGQPQRALNGYEVGGPAVTFEGKACFQDTPSGDEFVFMGPVDMELLSKNADDSLHQMDKAIVSFGNRMDSSSMHISHEMPMPMPPPPPPSAPRRQHHQPPQPQQQLQQQQHNRNYSRGLSKNATNSESDEGVGSGGDRNSWTSGRSTPDDATVPPTSKSSHKKSVSDRNHEALVKYLKNDWNAVKNSKNVTYY